MLAEALTYELPTELYATEPPEARGLERDGVRLLVQNRRATYGAARPQHVRFIDLPQFLKPGDLLVVNDSATVAASMPANGDEPLRIHLGNRLEDGTWLVEPRTAAGGPLTDRADVRAGSRFSLGSGLDRRAPTSPHSPSAELTLLEQYRGFARLWRARITGDLRGVVTRFGEPISYPYVPEPRPLTMYQTIFSRTPGSAEMPSAGRPFTKRLLNRLRAHGVDLATITLHTGLSSHEVETDIVEEAPVYPEWFRVPPETADAVNAHGRGAVG